MAAEHKTSEEAIYYEAIGKAPNQRDAYLQAACGQDAALLARVRVLLKAREVRDSFLESAPWDPAIVLDTPIVTEAPGTVIGRYKLLEKIGEGGMAVVYMAEQEQPIRRKVALKIIKLGMDTRQVIARFEAERQALALMDHPSIAKVLDAGATETGRPYFVMELVQGVSITEYCDKNSLSTKDRLALFLQVCRAVQHAHQKGIIHRDIKPSNVMVTHHDGQPIPKVIDFGIAKAMVRATHASPLLTEKTFFTRYGHIIGTPAYMSPEQAELSDLDIDTRSDIYSLGVLLYELLTGTTPFSEEELRKAGYLEMQRVIREQEPVKPSTRIRTAQLRGEGILPLRVAGILPALRGRPRTEGPLRVRLGTEESKAKMASGRKGGTPSPRLPYRRSTYEQVRGDLDWIVMKSLEKDRTRRYETASGLAEDIRRHLEHEPILARSPGATYRLRKFLRRHRSQVLTALVLVVAAGAAVVGLSQWSQGRRRLAEAQGLRHQAEGLRGKETLSQAREQYAKGDRDAALETIRSILDSSYVGPEARLLQAGILVDNRRPEEAVSILNRLLDEPPEIAGAVHALLARILWESGNLNTEKLEEIEEHRQRAEALLPDTAGAYFLRAMTAPTIREQLAALDKALDLDSTHYESLRLRTFTCHASRKYARMREDALGMTYLRRRDPLGYSLRALALRELGEYGDAITEYDRAMARMGKEDLQYPDLAAQRSEALLRMGEHRRVMADAEECLKSWPDRPVFQHHLFCALTAVGDYEKADHLSRQLVRRSQEARQQFQRWCARYIFDTLHAGRSWHPADRNPVGLAFLPLVEAEETYRTLSAKGRRVTTDGFSAQWSPDGKTLAFSLGVQGNSGVALFDPATNETELLIVPGKYPRWSPDGRYIAFVRDRQFLSVPEFVAADPKNQARAGTDQEVWFMRSDGTDPRRLARGTWPSWGRDSTCVYYRSPVDITLYAISIAGEAAEPRRILRCPGFVPFMSPDNTRVAYIEGTSLKVKDLTSQTVVAEWPVPSPSDGWGASAWSGSGTELCLGGSGGLQTRTGLWIYRLGQSEPAQTLGGPITVGSWAPNGTKLVFEVGAPHFEIWKADLAGGVSTLEALGPARTVEQHWRELVAFHTRRIEADPLDADAYSGRARCYDSLHERKRADADMKRWSAVMTGQSPWDLVFAAAHAPRHAIDMPFDCELVFSAERPVNTIPTMSIAFGQKGRCEMKLCEIPILSMSLVGLCLLAGLDAPPAHADFAFGTPVNLGPAVNTSFGDTGASLSPDGLTLYFSDVPFDIRPNGHGGQDIWVTTRVAEDAPWEKAVNLGPTLNTSPSDCIRK